MPARQEQRTKSTALISPQACKECGVAMTEAEDSQLASTAASDRAPIIGALLNHGLLVSTPEPQPVPNTDRRGTASSRR
jgi:hypothetical protein